MNDVVNLPASSLDQTLVGKGRLEELPPEILEKIIPLRFLDEKPFQPDLIKPLSKRLHPFYNSTLYRNITISKNLALSRLCSTMIDNPHLAELISHLFLNGKNLEVVDDPVQAETLDLALEIVIKSMLKVTELDVSGNFPSDHLTNFASLFPAVEKLDLAQNSFDVAPNYSSFLSTIRPDSLKKLSLDSLTVANYQIHAGEVPIHQHLLRFKNLSYLRFIDRRTFDHELLTTILSMKCLDRLYIDDNCRISVDLIKQLLYGLKNRVLVKRFEFELDLEMEVGIIGKTYKSGAKVVVEDGILVPADDWKKPIWNSISAREGEELVELAKEMKVVFRGTIPKAIRVEKAFEKGMAWLDICNHFIKTGEVKKDL